MALHSTLLCVPLTAPSVEQMLRQMDEAKAAGADIAEIRLDHLKNFQPQQDLQLLLNHGKLPSLVTYRPKWEGGEYEGDEQKRLDVLRLAVDLGADYVDVELQVGNDFISSISGNKPEKLKIIVSSHNYQATPSIDDLVDLVARIQATGADIVKIATTATNITDVARMFQIMVHCQVPIIGLVMGDKGHISRVLCPKYGGYLTFCTLEDGKESAPGQPKLRDLLDLYNIREIGPDTEVFGIIGNPVGHSKGPMLYNAAFKHIGYNAIFVHLLVDDLPSFLESYSSPDFAGFSCTIPHKETAVVCCDEVDPIAKSIGAVNTIIRKKDGKLIGYNTDYYGAISAIEDGLRGSNADTNTTNSPLDGKLFVVIGAGGAGKALAYGAKEKGARVVIANRTYDRAREVADIVGAEAITLSDLENFHPEKGMILANTTSVGMKPKVDETPIPKVDETPIPKHALKSYALVFDAVYTPKMTRLLLDARESGATVVTGVEMFIRQAKGQFEHFTGLPAPMNAMRDVASKI